MKADWIAVDWGTSNLRMWAMSRQGEAIAEKHLPQGVGDLAREAFATVLMKHITRWLCHDVTPVVACGMVGSRQGWCEVPYATVPAKPATKVHRVGATDSRIDLHIVGGVKEDNPAGVMRGEETQLAGLLAQQPDFSGTVCMPGTHSKWVIIKNHAIHTFRTYMTGELFSLLTQHSILRHNLGAWDNASFLDQANNSLHSPQQLSAQLFSIRAAQLLEQNNAGIARLSGALIGAELAATKCYWQTETVTIIGANTLANLYQMVLETLGVQVVVVDITNLTLRGLTQVYNKIYKNG